MNCSCRRWITGFLAAFAVACALLGAFVWLVDPLWCFTHANRLNARQLPFDERQQKSDFLAARSPAYDAVMLGSSRVTMIDQRDLAGYRAFNFSVNAMLPDEYAAYVRYLKRHNRGPLRLVFLGADFFGSNANFKGYGHKVPEYYFGNAENPWFRYRTLLTQDAVYYAYRNVRQLFAPTTHHFYDRDNVKFVTPITARFRNAGIAHDLAEFDRYLYGKTYRYHDIRPILRRLQEENRESRFLVFTSPDSKPLWDYIVRTGRVEDYLRWLGDLVEVFGEVYDFMGENELTTDLENYQDAHHLTPAAARRLVQRMLAPDAPGRLDAGVLVTPQNYRSHAERIRSRYADSRH